MVGTDGSTLNEDEEAELERLEGRQPTAAASSLPSAAFTRENPMPEDVTVEELAARPKKPRAPRKASSDQTYGKTANKWWPLFLKAAGWCAIDKNIWLTAEGKPRDGIFRQLFIWLYEQEVTKSIFKTMLSWAQSGLTAQLSARLLDAKREYVCNIAGVKERKDEIYTDKRESHMAAMVDLQAEVESDVGFDGMMRMAMRCLNVDIPNTSALFCMQTFFELRATHQQGARHDDLREEVFAHIFSRQSPKLGVNGMTLLANVTDGGKTNKNGRVSYSALISHRNPILSAIFAKAALFLWRFLIMGVPFPELLDPKDIFRRPTLRQGYDDFGHVSYDSSYTIMKRLYESEKIVVTKCLHQGRGECQRELDDDGVELDMIKRLCKYIHDDQTDSYLLNPPLAALLSRAGFDHEMPRSAYAAHLAVKPPAELIAELLPALIIQEQKIEAAFRMAASGAEAKKKRLFCARGCSRALRTLCIEFLQASAARRRDESNVIIMDSAPIYKLFFATNRLYQLPIFSSKAFLVFAGQVAAAEEREYSGSIDEGMPTSLTPITDRLMGCMARKVDPLSAKMDTVLARLDAAGPAAGPAAATPASASASAGDLGSRPKTVEQHVAAAVAKRAAKHGVQAVPIYMLSRGKTTVAELWHEYTAAGIPTGPAVKELVAQYGTKWRSYKGGKEDFAWHSHIYDEIERLIAAGSTAEAAVSILQVELTSFQKDQNDGRGRKSTVSSQWRALVTRIRGSHPRAGHLPGPRKRTREPAEPCESAADEPTAAGM